MNRVTLGLSIIVITVLVGCGGTDDSSTSTTKDELTYNTSQEDSLTTQNSLTHDSSKQTVAYFGDKENNLVVVVDIDNMKRLESITTGHEKSYSAEIIETLDNEHDRTPKMYVANRGSNAIDVLDSATNTITQTIDLSFYPRSIDVEPTRGWVAVSSSNKAMTSIIDSRTDSVIATVGEDVVTAPTTSGHDYLSSGTLSSGHPHWLDENHFVLIDRQNKKIITYKLIELGDGTYTTSKVNELITPSPVHNLIPPELHGVHGVASKHGGEDVYLSTIFFATAEGSENVYPSVLELEFSPSEGLTIVDELKIQKEGTLPNVMGVHHLNFLKDMKSIYVGSDEGTLFVVDYSVSPMRILKTVPAGKGAGHTDEMEHNSIAVVINHKDKFITVMNTDTHTKIADIEVSNLDEVGTVQTQSHPKYHFSKDGRYFYLFLTEEGALVKVDLIEKKVVERLEIGGKLAMGSFLEF
jgi:YVTN family beta-propeller protein